MTLVSVKFDVDLLNIYRVTSCKLPHFFGFCNFALDLYATLFIPELRSLSLQ